MIIDTHAHLMSKDYNGELDQILNNAKKVSVERVINIGFDLESSIQAIEIANKYPQCYSAIGIHPYDSAQFSDKLIDEWGSKIINNKKIVAIGECGLDYFKCDVSVDLQKHVFREQIKIAQKASLPIIVHNRDADNDTLEILDEFEGLKVVFHCFGSDLNFAKKLWDRGFYTSFTGIITFPKADNIREVVKNVPLDRFMVETDCPWLAPQDVRGQRCEPAFVVSIVKKIAEIRGMSFSDIEEISTKNAFSFFSRMN
jgi:TatD DNase family protein